MRDLRTQNSATEIKCITTNAFAPLIATHARFQDSYEHFTFFENTCLLWHIVGKIRAPGLCLPKHRNCIGQIRISHFHRVKIRNDDDYGFPEH